MNKLDFWLIDDAREKALRRGVPRNGTTHDPGAGISRPPLMDDFAAADQLFWGNASQAPPGGTIRASNRREVYRGPVAPIGPHADSVRTRGLAGIASQTRGRRRSYTSRRARHAGLARCAADAARRARNPRSPGGGDPCAGAPRRTGSRASGANACEPLQSARGAANATDAKAE